MGVEFVEVTRRSFVQAAVAFCAGLGLSPRLTFAERTERQEVFVPPGSRFWVAQVDGIEIGPVAKTIIQLEPKYKRRSGIYSLSFCTDTKDPVSCEPLTFAIESQKARIADGNRIVPAPVYAEADPNIWAWTDGYAGRVNCLLEELIHPMCGYQWEAAYQWHIPIHDLPVGLVAQCAVPRRVTASIVGCNF